VIGGAIDWIGTLGEAGRATALELHLIVRHRRTRGLCMLLLVFGPLMCYAAALSEDPVFLLLSVQYISMGFPYAYGAILFSGDHRHLEGLLARTSDTALLVRGKVRAMQIMTGILFFLIFPSLLFLPARDALFVAVWVPFGLFVFAPLSVHFAASTKERADLSTSAFAPKASSFHMLPLVFPLLLVFAIVFLHAETGHWAWTVVPVLSGLLGAALVPKLRQATTRKLERRKYRLLHSFRSTEPT